MPSEANAWTLLKCLKDERLLVCYHNAGMGKTAFSHMLVHQLLRAHESKFRHHGLAAVDDLPLIVVRIEGEWPRDSTKRALDVVDVVAEEILNMHPDGRNRSATDNSRDGRHPCKDDVRSSVQVAMNKGRVFILIDGFDQMSAADQEASITFINSSLNAAGSCHRCHWLVSGRAYSLQRFSGDGQLFDHSVYRFRMEPFDGPMQDRYFADLNKSTPFAGMVLDAVCKDRQAMELDLGVPLHLALIRTLIEDCLANGKPLPQVDNVADLHLRVSDLQLARTLNQFGTDGSVFATRLRLLREVCGVLALQMMLDKIHGGVVHEGLQPESALGYLPHNMVSQLVARSKARFFAMRRYHKRPEEVPEQPELDWNWALDLLKTDLFSYRLELDRSDEICLSFRSRKTMEWYAAHYLVNYMTDGDLNEAVPNAGTSSVSQGFGDHAWRRCWELAFEMPWRAIKWATVLKLCRGLFSKPPKGCRRPCWEMYWAWTRWLTSNVTSGLKEDADAIVAGFRQQFCECFAAESQAPLPHGVGESQRRPAARLRLSRDGVAPGMEFGDPANQDWYRSIPPIEADMTSRSNARLWMRKFVVTNDEYRLFDPSHGSSGQPNDGGSLADDELPVTNVNWYMASMFCRWLGEGYCLPTQDEWGKACRAGTTTKYWFPDSDSPEQHMWFDGNSGGRPRSLSESEEAKGHENPWGLVDMHGNVWEWCEDIVGATRPVRGGGWRHPATFSQASQANRDDPDGGDDDLGFRVAFRG